MRTLQRVLLAAAALVLLLAAAVAINTLRQGSRQLDVPPAPPLALDAQAVAEKLAGAVRFRTIANLADPQASAGEFRGLHDYLQQRFPRVHASLKREVVAGFGLLYTWAGTDPQAKAIALLAHHDVVPIEPGTEGQWQQPPFSGAIRDGYVWGRGTWDDKGNLVAQMEAVEHLLAAGFRPRRTIYLVSTADEELAHRGAQEVVRLLQERKTRLDFVLDEGLVLTQGLVPGVQAPVALVGVAEKGYLSVRLKADAPGGHSSLPPPAGTGAIAVLSEALRRLDRDQMPAALEGVAREMFETAAPEMSGMQRVLLSNLWLFGPVVRAQLEKSPGTNAMLRTTTALTLVHAGEKDNVLPGHAEATANFRLLPGDTRERVMNHVRTAVARRVAVQELSGAYEATPVASIRSGGYLQIERTLRSLFPGVVVAPGLYVAGSDSRLFVPVADQIFRFSPVRARAEDLPRLHGTNERLSVANLAELVRFYHQLLRNLNAPAP